MISCDPSPFRASQEQNALAPSRDSLSKRPCAMTALRPLRSILVTGSSYVAPSSPPFATPPSLHRSRTRCLRRPPKQRAVPPPVSFALTHAPRALAFAGLLISTASVFTRPRRPATELRRRKPCSATLPDGYAGTHSLRSFRIHGERSQQRDKERQIEAYSEDEVCKWLGTVKRGMGGSDRVTGRVVQGTRSGEIGQGYQERERRNASD
ncbi:hypothetical protein EDB89DRAFT_140668 [Lactarius sanguifluus]|nr:hypothetical protein EDB89DRAFT_140668 [Lactarius sanguifluus]